MAGREEKLTIHYYAERGDVDKLTRLLNNGCPVDKRACFGQTPLFIGAKYCQEEIVKVLISHGADVNVEDDNGKTPLHKSAQSGNTEIVNLLIQHRADVNVNDWHGKTPLHNSAESGHTEIVKLLIQHGADFKVKDNYEQTPLHDSARSGHTEIVNLLIQHGADVNVKDIFEKTPLHRSAASGHTEIVNLLIQHRDEVNVKDIYGQTPLHRSAWSGHTEIVKLLIQHGVDIDPVDVDGFTPLMLAESSGHKDIVKILRKAKPMQAGDGRLRKFFGIFSGYSSSTRKLSIQSSDGRGRITKVKYEDKEVRSHVTGAVSTSESGTGREGKVDKVKVTTKKESQGHKKQELVTKSAEASSYLTTSMLDVCTSAGLSSTPAASEQPLASASSSPTPLPPSPQTTPPSSLVSSPQSRTPSPPPSPQTTPPSPQTPRPLPKTPPLSSLTSSPQPRTPRPSSRQQPSPLVQSLPTSSSITSPPQPQTLPPQPTLPQPQPRDEVTEYAQKLLKAVKGQRNSDQDPLNVPSEQLGASVIFVEQKTVNNHYNTYHNHCHTCQCNNKQTTCEEVLESSETLNVSVGSTRYGPLHPPQGGDCEDRGTECEGRDRQTFDVDMTGEAYTDVQASTFRESTSSRTTTTSTLSSSSAPTSTPATTDTASDEIRRRLESQAEYMEKMVQSCVAGGGVCQDQSSDLVPLHHGAYVPVNLNFFMQPKNVEVNSAKQVTCGKVDVENADWVGSNNTITYNYAARSCSDDEDEDNTEDDNSENDKVVHIEDDSE